MAKWIRVSVPSIYGLSLPSDSRRQRIIFSLSPLFLVLFLSLFSLPPLLSAGELGKGFHSFLPLQAAAYDLLSLDLDINLSRSPSLDLDLDIDLPLLSLFLLLSLYLPLYWCPLTLHLLPLSLVLSLSVK